MSSSCRRRGSTSSEGDGNQSTRSCAVNVDPVEADLPIDPKEIVAAALGGATEGEGAQPNGIPLTPEAKERISGSGVLADCGNFAAGRGYAALQPDGKKLSAWGC